MTELANALDSVLALQPTWNSIKTPEMDERGILVRQTIPKFLEQRMGTRHLKVRGSNGAGRNARIPW